ncbi:MAG TPA: biotin--[acetyl-CoA-carboxylase] ligase, partial [Brevundimonas diminuta]|nr:biotin--[acetyl-CoA-carboxylase] ligase [Brevundimonas diminuta]
MAAPVLTREEPAPTTAEARRRAEAGEAGPLWI